MNSNIPFWAAVLLAFAGYLAAVVTEVVRGNQTLKRERESRRELRQAQRDDARDGFERDTLIQLQDTMGRLMRSFARINHLDELEYNRSGTWGRHLLPDEVGGEVSTTLMRDFQRFRVRLLDDRLRDLASGWLDAGSRATIGALRGEPDANARVRALAAWDECGTLYTQVAEMVGRRLRTLVGGS